MEEIVPGIHLLKEAAKGEVLSVITYRYSFLLTLMPIAPLFIKNELQGSNALRRLLLLIVNIGNYINGTSTHGCAAGFKLSSLWKVIDHRATKGTSSLLHLLAKV
uniref:FH2 domain-containing protein n=1 Tax=Angiostrongylus cantonensis TaxID=6313 RepID=A0A0K0DBW7_ANGCA